MAGCSWLRKRAIRRWRRAYIRENARRWKTQRSLRGVRRGLCFILGLELLAGAAHNIRDRGFCLVRQERVYAIEWTESGMNWESGAGEGTHRQQIFGVRFLRDSLELQFYHRSQEIVPSETIESH